MKNNEILISVKFESQKRERTMSFLVLKDITLKSLLQGLYYGLRNLSDKEDTDKNKDQIDNKRQLTDSDCYKLFVEYIQSRGSILVLFTKNGEFEKFVMTEDYEDTFDNHKIKKTADCTLSGLGIVTASFIYITDETVINKSEKMIKPLFPDKTKSYILKDDNADLEYNISTRRLNVMEPAVIDIISSGDLPKPSNNTILDVIIPPLISAIGMFGIRFLISKFSSSSAMSDSMMAMTIAMPLVSLITTSYNHRKQKKTHELSSKEWKENYEKYIKEVIISRIVEWQRNEISYLNNVYPSLEGLYIQASEISPIIFSRSQNDNDFMKISLGQSNQIRPIFEIKSEKKDSIIYDVYYRLEGDDKGGYSISIEMPEKKKNRKKKSVKEVQKSNDGRYPLTDLPYNFANLDQKDSKTYGFKYLRDGKGMRKPPLLVDLFLSGVLGVISNNKDQSYRLAKQISFELAYYHSPEDLQMVFFFEEEPNVQEQYLIVDDYKYLPHTNELVDDTSQFVFDKQSAGDMFSKLQTIMAERSKNNDGEDEDIKEKLTQIVCFVFCDYEIKKSAFSRYLPETPKEGEPYVNKNGLTFIFIQDEKGKLPKYCGNIIEMDHKTISNRYNVLSRETLKQLTEDIQGNEALAASTDRLIEYTSFENDFIYNGVGLQQLNMAYKQLSSIYYTRVAENGKVPSMVTLYGLYEFLKDEDHEVEKQIKKRWDEASLKQIVTRNMKVPMGKNEHDVTYLDLHENADGPHMLVAGTTGSGKSETILTYLIGLCINYSPMDLNFMLVDMKGGGFSDRLGMLPHCVGTVDDKTGEEEGIPAVYMLKRFLITITAEIKKRKLILPTLEVDNADAYIQVYKNLEFIHKLANEEEKVAALKTKMLECWHSTESLKKAERIKKVGQIQSSSENEKLAKKLIKSILNKEVTKQIAAIDGDLTHFRKKFRPLSHLILVVDEFTELKRFSSEANDVDFIAEITTIARVGRTLGLHIILVSQNIEGAINDDIRVNTKSKICLKVATKQASKEMLGTPDAASPTMPLHGRAYILVGTGSRYEYFQSAYTGADENTSIGNSVKITYVPNTGSFNSNFYNSDKHNDVIVKKKESAGTTQLQYVVTRIKKISENLPKHELPEKIFCPPLPTKEKEGNINVPWKGV